ncbi:hypothetical protein TanjilG_22427 [Lupinus angustifolius]|uniref:Cytochrome P450 n=1 Tax=Lupinus angustifolius TaxID=3871 RepID=A0A4P1RSX8_LUPAN|nr:PREDICTED: cytochrome P450 82A4-like [Lupinus angustifolius]OIW17315.1 hypothetical protein TanjilG_22427 [Lupinus angustifolius]
MDFVQNSVNAAGVGIFSLVILCFVVWHHFKASKGKEAPMVSGSWPILGHLPLLSGSKATHHILGAMADRYGPVFTIKLGSAPVLVVNNWESAKECFTTNDLTLSYRPSLLMTEHMTYNQGMFSFSPYGAYWRETRKIINSGFLSNNKVDLLSDIRVFEVKSSIQELFNLWLRKKDDSDFMLVEMKQWFRELALNVTFHMFAGKKYFGGDATNNDKESQKCIKTIREFLRLVGVYTVADAIPFLRWFDFGGHEKAMKKTFKELDSVIGGWLEEHRKKKASDHDEKSNKDFIDVMLSMIDGSTIEGIDSDTVIKATTMTLVLGATDTSIVTHTWAICLLLNNPHALEKVKEEIDMNVGKERCVNESDINNLVYLQAVVKETLRLYPASPLTVREFGQDCNIGGYYVKKGTRLFTNLWKIQTDPTMWPDPLEFKPERFLTTHKNVDVRGHNFEFIPFGSGRRICPGITFGLRTTYLTLATFLQSFEISKPSNKPIDMSAIVEVTNIKVTPLEILIKPRLCSNIYENM